MNTKLEAYDQDFGYEQMMWIWRRALNFWVDSALASPVAESTRIQFGFRFS